MRPQTISGEDHYTEQALWKEEGMLLGRAYITCTQNVRTYTNSYICLNVQEHPYLPR